MAIRSCLREIWADDIGQDLVEYALLLAIIALAAIILVSSAGNSVKTTWSAANTQLKSAAS